MVEWRAGVRDETRNRRQSACQQRYVKGLPVAPGAMRLPAPEPVEGACSRVASAQLATGDDRRHITYRQTLDFVGDDRAAGRVISRVALFVNHTLLANDSLPKGGYIC